VVVWLVGYECSVVLKIVLLKIWYIEAYIACSGALTQRSRPTVAHDSPQPTAGSAW
jgi:hypothetical protein